MSYCSGIQGKCDFERVSQIFCYLLSHVRYYDIIMRTLTIVYYMCIEIIALPVHTTSYTVFMTLNWTNTHYIYNNCWVQLNKNSRHKCCCLRSKLINSAVVLLCAVCKLLNNNKSMTVISWKYHVNCVIFDYDSP